MTTPPAATGPEPRAGRAAFALALLVVVAGSAYLGFAPEHWLRGVFVIAGGLSFAGLARLVLADRRAGPLRVRARWFDGGCFLLAGVAVAFFGVVVR